MPDRAGRKAAVWWLYAALVLLVWAVFGQTLAFEFVNFDDTRYVAGHWRIQRGLTWDNVAWATTTNYFSNWHPATWWSLLLDAELYGPAAGGFHATNVVLHSANVLLLFVLLCRMTGAPGAAVFVAALFAIHPLQVEAVAWVSSRKDVLSLFFGLLAMLAYTRYVEAKSWRWYGGLVVAYVLSLAAKQTLVTLPCLLLLLDYWPLGRFATETGDSDRTSIRRAVLEKLPLFAMAGSACVLAILAQHDQALRQLEAYPLSVRICNALVAYGLYLAKFVLPRNLGVFYPHPGEAVVGLAAIGAGALLLAITALAIHFRQRIPCAFVGWLWFVGTLVPMIGLVQVGNQQLADRYMYVPLIGLAWGTVWLLVEAGKTWGVAPRARPVFATGIVLLLTGVAFAQTRYWRNSVALFDHALAAGVDSGLAHNNIGSALEHQGQRAEALAHYEEALQLDPQDPLAHANSGSALEKLGRPAEALGHLTEAVRIAPDMVLARTNLGGLLVRMGRAAEAVDHLRSAVELDADNVAAHHNLAVAWGALGQPDEAIRHNQAALALNPDFEPAHTNLARELAQLGQIEAAIVHASEAVRIDPQSARAHYNLGALLMSRQQDRTAALSHLEEAQRLDPTLAQAANLARPSNRP